MDCRCSFRLCKETKSEVLAAHYLARLREEYPEQFERYATWNEHLRGDQTTEDSEDMEKKEL